MPLIFTTGVVRWDWILFTATTTAFVAHLYYYNDDALLSRNKKSRMSRSMKQVSFRLDSTTMTENEESKRAGLHTSITDLLPSTLSDALSSSSPSPKIIGLLFAARWCPECTNVVPAIGKVTDVVATDSVDKDWLKVIYVSSDLDELSIEQFKPSSMLHIPHSAVQERTMIKQKYSTCAMKEMSALQISPPRKNGIPTLILLNAMTGAILSENGVDDVMDRTTTNEQVLEQWKKLISN